MSKILRKIQSGRLVYAVVYTAPVAGDSPRQRTQKRPASTAAREKLNARTSFQKLERKPVLCTKFVISNILSNSIKTYRIR